MEALRYKRRILQGEKIAHEEKVFSIFEPYVEWINKGKSGKQVELGKNILIASDQYHFIVDYQTVEYTHDVDLAQPLAQRLSEKYNAKNNYELAQISLDTNFYSQPNVVVIQKYFKRVIIPKKGKKSQAYQQQIQKHAWKEGRKKHAAIEANINELEHHGLNKCPDKTLPHFKRYVGCSVLSYNLSRLGKLLLNKSGK